MIGKQFSGRFESSIQNHVISDYICEFGRAGNGGGAPDRAGTFGNSFVVGLLPLVAVCRFGSGGGVPIALGTDGCGRLDGGDGAVLVTIFRLGLAVFDLLGLTSKS